MLRPLLIAAFLAAGVRAFAPTLIRWRGISAKGFVLAPSASLNRALVPHKAVVVPHSLAIWDEELPSTMTPNGLAYFTTQPDNTIALHGTGLCIGALGDTSGDAVSVNICTGEPKQLWNILPLGQQHRNQIQLKGTGECIDVHGKEGWLNGAPVELRNCDDTSTEAWDFEVPPFLPAKRSAHWHLFSVSMGELVLLIGSMIVLGVLSVAAWFHGVTTDEGGVLVTAPLAAFQNGFTLESKLAEHKIEMETSLEALAAENSEARWRRTPEWPTAILGASEASAVMAVSPLLADGDDGVDVGDGDVVPMEVQTHTDLGTSGAKLTDAEDATDYGTSMFEAMLTEETDQTLRQMIWPFAGTVNSDTLSPQLKDLATPALGPEAVMDKALLNETAVRRSVHLSTNQHHASRVEMESHHAFQPECLESKMAQQTSEMEAFVSETAGMESHHASEFKFLESKLTEQTLGIEVGKTWRLNVAVGKIEMERRLTSQLAHVPYFAPRTGLIQAMAAKPKKFAKEISVSNIEEINVSDTEDLAPSAGLDWGGHEAELRQSLLTWFASGRRKLPWRGDPPPWATYKSGSRKAAATDAEATKPAKVAYYFECKRKTAPTGDVLEIDLIDAECGSGKVDIDVDDASFAAPSSGSTSAPTAEGLKPESKVQSTQEKRWFACSPYGTWVSEVMLQQTQVGRVVGYWTQWMERFPSIQALADADISAVYAVWAGLGYYGRAKRLHEGAKYVVANHAGELPNDTDALLCIPGIGPYTAGAIASIAFGQKAAVVDGNVKRVFSRLLALRGDAASSVLARKCWDLAKALVDQDDPGNFNQALMELGAVVCTPKAPVCDRCPLKRRCRAASLMASGKLTSVTEFPEKAVKKQRKVRRFAVVVVQDAAARALFLRRPPTGLLAGQWEFPSVELELCAEGDDDSVRMQQALHEKVAGLDLNKGNKHLPDLKKSVIPIVEHCFSHERHIMHVWHMLWGGEVDDHVADLSGKPEAFSWMTVAEAESSGITSGVRKVMVSAGLCKKDTT